MAKSLDILLNSIEFLKDKAAQTVQSFNSNKAICYTLGTFMTMTPVLAKAGSFSDDFEFPNPLIGSGDSAWTVLIDQGNALSKVNGQLKLEAPAGGGVDEIHTPTYSQGATTSTVKAEFPGQIPPDRNNYSIKFLDSGNNDVAELMVLTIGGSTDVYFFSGNPTASIAYDPTTQTLCLERDASNNIRAFVDTGTTRTQVGSAYNRSGDLKGGLKGGNSGFSVDPVDFVVNSFSYTNDNILRNIINGELNSDPSTSPVLNGNYTTVDNLVVMAADLGYGDPNGDPENAAQRQIRWLRDGVHVPELDGFMNVPSTHTLKNQEWHYEVDVTDNPPVGNPGVSITQSSNKVTIGNSDPSIDSAVMNPGSGDKGTTFTANVTNLQDPDTSDTLSVNYQWEREVSPGVWEAIPGATSQIIDGTYFNKNDTIRAACTPTDQVTSGATMYSAGVTIADSPGLIDLLTLPTEMATDKDVTPTSATSDLDGDAVPLNVEWLKYNATSDSFVVEPAYNGLAVLPSSATQFGDRWKVRATAPGNSLESNEIEITPPTNIGQEPLSVVFWQTYE